MEREEAGTGSWEQDMLERQHRTSLYEIVASELVEILEAEQTGRDMTERVIVIGTYAYQ